MEIAAFAYPTLVYVHLLLFAFWLGADVGVFLLGQHFRKRDRYTLDQRIALLQLLVLVDMAPRSAWALMPAVALSVTALGGWWAIPVAWLAIAWLGSGLWLWFVWDAHRHDQTPRAARDRRIEAGLRGGFGLFFFILGAWSLAAGAPLASHWLAWKALLFGCIFVAAIMIDATFRPVGAQLATLLREGSSDETEIPLRKTMDRTRLWVWLIYVLLVVTSWLGVAKPS